MFTGEKQFSQGKQFSVVLTDFLVIDQHNYSLKGKERAHWGEQQSGRIYTVLICMIPTVYLMVLLPVILHSCGNFKADYCQFQELHQLLGIAGVRMTWIYYFLA